jgi:biotin carboxylase
MENKECYGKRIIVVGASDFQLPAILKAKEMGLYVGVVDFNPNAPGVAFADEYFNVSTIDQEGICLVAREFNADGIITLCTDMPMRAVAYTCEKLNLNGVSQRTSLNATDKGVMIQQFEKDNIEHPSYVILRKGEDFKSIIKNLKFPLITKPTDNSGSRGVMLVKEIKELESAISYSSSYGRSGDVIVEEYMQGPEVSVEIMVIDGEAYVIQVTDKLTTGEPHFVEIGHSQPSRLPTTTIEKIKNIAKKASISVGIKNGPAHAEIIVTEDGPKMVEIGARMGGGCITTHLVPLSTGIDMTKASIETALGEKPDIRQKYNQGAAIRFIIPPIGKVISILGKEEAEQIPGVQLVDIQCTKGQRLEELENGTSRIGYVIAQGKNPDEAIKICEEALKKIKIEVC